MNGILLISQGNLAEGMRDTLELFSGKVNQLDAVTLFAGQDISEFSVNLERKINGIDTGEGVVIFCDLAFGAPTSIVIKLLVNLEHREKIQVITGMNLPLVLAYSQLRSKKIDFNDIVEVGKSGIINLNESLIS